MNDEFIIFPMSMTGLINSLVKETFVKERLEGTR